MRIAYLNPVGCVGGAERVLLAVMAAARQADPSLEAHLIASTDGPLLRQAEAVGVRAVLLPMTGALAEVGDSRHRDSGWLGRSWGVLRQAAAGAPELWRYGRRLRARLRELAPDLVHSNGIKSHLLARLAAPRGAAVLWHVHDFYSERPVVRRVLRWARKGVAGAIAVSEAVAKDTQALLPGLPTRVIHNAIDVSAFAPGPADPGLLDRLAGLPPAEGGTVRVGLVATYARWKGQDVFLHAAARVLGESPLPVRFYVVGGPIYHTRGSQFSPDELRSLARRLGVEGRVGFVGFQDNPAHAYRGLDVVVHTSTRPEPFGLTIVEAMACARAVLVARAGGAAELFTHGVDAVGFPPGDVPALARVVGELVRDARLRQRLGDNARRTAVRRFSCQRLGPQVLDAYRGVLGKRSGAGNLAKWQP
jgi:glycosyltransferase involved in cell wall biosynthesis